MRRALHQAASRRTRSLHHSARALASAALARAHTPPTEDHYIPYGKQRVVVTIDDDETGAQRFPRWDELRVDDAPEPAETHIASWEGYQGSSRDLLMDVGEDGEDEGENEGMSWVREVVREGLDLETPKPKPVATKPTVKSVKGKEVVKEENVVKASSRPEVRAMATRKPYTPSTTLPTDSPLRPYHPTPNLDTSQPKQPHHQPLLSRYDWRLSSPIPRRHRAGSLTPPNLSLKRNRDLTRQGLNKVVGVGPSPAVEARRWKESKEELWGWKIRASDSERGKWTSCDEYRKRQDRLIALSRAADETGFLKFLERNGTPAEREAKGTTVAAATGSWVGESGTPDKIEAAIAKAEAAKKSGVKLPWSPSGIVSVWRRADGGFVDEQHGYKFTDGMILRFTRVPPEEANPNGPQLPPSASTDFVQGQLLEIKDGQLIVGFKEMDVWILGEEEYRIDIGLDDTGYQLQESALDHLYYDPARQRAHNEVQVQAAQETVERGIKTPLREWALQGTEVRELLVPDLDTLKALNSSSSSSEIDFSDFDDSPAAEISHLPPPTMPDVSTSTTPDPSRSMNPSKMFHDNQLINSWIKRHLMDPPMRMPGDPELGLNASQTKAVAMALSETLSLIQGPPGTGKSQTIVQVIKLLKLHFRIPQPILLAAPTHVSIDHLLYLLIQAGLNPFRMGKSSKVRDTLQSWTIEQRAQEHPLWDATEKARVAAEGKRQTLAEHKDKMFQSGTKKTPRMVERTAELESDYQKGWRKFIWLEQRLYSSLFATGDVFCTTTMGASTNKLLNMIDFPIVFIDEAAMATEPVTMIPLMKGAAQVTLIGDHKQLPAVVTSQIVKQERLHESLFERLMKQKSVSTVLLDTQYRMRPSISEFPNRAFYNDALSDSASVQARPPPYRSTFFPNPTLPTAFITHDHRESYRNESTENVSEAWIIVSLVGDLLRKNPGLAAEDIGIISPYASQTWQLRRIFDNFAERRLQPLLGYRRAEEVSKVEINTVDGFQGREKEFIILSTVRSNTHGRIGFLTDKRRLNVALTRAKNGLFVVGNAKTLKTGSVSDWGAADVDADASVWRRYLAWLEEKKLVRKWREDDALI